MFSLPLEELHHKASKSTGQESSVEWSRFPLLPNGGSALVNFNGQLLAVGGRIPKTLCNCKKCYLFNESSQEWVLSGEIRTEPCVGLFAFYDPYEDILEVIGVLGLRFGLKPIFILLLWVLFCTFINIILLLYFFMKSNPRLHFNQLSKDKLRLIFDLPGVIFFIVFLTICTKWRSIDLY